MDRGVRPLLSRANQHRSREALAKTISKRYAKILKGGHIKVMPLLKSRNRILYRARIIGIAQRNAHRTCKILKKYRKPCLTINLHPSTEVASR